VPSVVFFEGVHGDFFHRPVLLEYGLPLEPAVEALREVHGVALLPVGYLFKWRTPVI